MTLIDTIAPVGPAAHARVRVNRHGRDPRQRPGGAPLRYRRTGLPASQTAHRARPIKRPVTPATTVALALLAAVITMWLGLVAHFGAAAAGTGAAGAAGAAVPDQLGVVRVADGESLQHLAARVAPGVPTGQVVDRIRELNGLESVALDAGQTLIAPIA